MAADDSLHARLFSLFEVDWRWRLDDSPEFETFVYGTHANDDKLDDRSLESFVRREQHSNNMLSRAREFDPAKLSADDRLNLSLFVDQHETYLRGLRFKPYLTPINFLEGPHIDLPQLVGWMRLETEAQLRACISRLRAFPRQVDQIIQLLDKGIEEGRTTPKAALKNVEASISVHADKPPRETVFFECFRKLPESIEGQVRMQLQREAEAAIAESVQPAFKKLRNYVANTYYPNARETIACIALPDGADHYAACLRFHTTTAMSAQAIHAVGVETVASIKREMEAIMDEVGFAGDDGSGGDADTRLAAFTKHLQADPSHFYVNGADLIEGYDRMCREKIEPLLPAFFGRLPRASYKIQSMPEHQAMGAPAAYYLSGSADGSRPGVFYVNSYNLAGCPQYEMVALSLHEAIPGHHLQGALALEGEGLPAFRTTIEDRRYHEAPGKFPMNTGYIEGWGLYSEYLGIEMGLYTDPYARFGRLCYAMLRATRLVVDTGMHALGWDRGRAIQLLSRNASMGLHEATMEIDRYIAWPGQACAYKIGDIKIRELRRRAEAALCTSNNGSTAFDVREFHDEILRCGAVPLEVLSQVVDDYVARKKAATSLSH